MKRFLIVVLPVVLVVLLSALALAHDPMGGGMGCGMMGPGMMGGCPHMGWGMMGPGMMGGCPHMGWGMMGPGTAAAPYITEQRAKELAQQYAQLHLPGFAVEQLLPFAQMGMTMYQAELKGPKGEVRILHVDPWGNVMPFGGPVTR